MSENQGEGQSQGAGQGESQGPTQQEKTFGMLSHLTALALFIGIPFGNILGPLVIWLIKKDELPFVDDQGKESLNFQISMLIYGAGAGILSLILIGIPLLFAIAIFDIVVVIMAAVQANSGTRYRYPLCIRFIK